MERIKHAKISSLFLLQKCTNRSSIRHHQPFKNEPGWSYLVFRKLNTYKVILYQQARSSIKLALKCISSYTIRTSYIKVFYRRLSFSQVLCLVMITLRPPHLTFNTKERSIPSSWASQSWPTYYEVMWMTWSKYAASSSTLHIHFLGTDPFPGKKGRDAYYDIFMYLPVFKRSIYFL